jgi:hypothetical protein
LGITSSGPAFTLAGGKSKMIPELTKPGKQRMPLEAAWPAGRKGVVMLRNNQSESKVPQNSHFQRAVCLAHAWPCSERPAAQIRHISK